MSRRLDKALRETVRYAELSIYYIRTFPDGTLHHRTVEAFHAFAGQFLDGQERVLRAVFHDQRWCILTGNEPTLRINR